VLQNRHLVEAEAVAEGVEALETDQIQEEAVEDPQAILRYWDLLLTKAWTFHLAKAVGLQAACSHS